MACNWWRKWHTLIPRDVIVICDRTNEPPQPQDHLREEMQALNLTTQKCAYTVHVIFLHLPTNGVLAYFNWRCLNIPRCHLSFFPFAVSKVFRQWQPRLSLIRWSLSDSSDLGESRPSSSLCCDIPQIVSNSQHTQSNPHLSSTSEHPCECDSHTLL